MKKIRIFTLFILIFVSVVIAEVKKVDQKVVKAISVEETIKIDGFLKEKVWQNKGNVLVQKVSKHSLYASGMPENVIKSGIQHQEFPIRKMASAIMKCVKQGSASYADRKTANSGFTGIALMAVKILPAVLVVGFVSRSVLPWIGFVVMSALVALFHLAQSIPRIYRSDVSVDFGKIKVFDPQAMEKAAGVLSGVKFCRDAYEAARSSDCLVILTEWNEFKEMDLIKIKKLLKTFDEMIEKSPANLRLVDI